MQKNRVGSREREREEFHFYKIGLRNARPVTGIQKPEPRNRNLSPEIPRKKRKIHPQGPTPYSLKNSNQNCAAAPENARKNVFSGAMQYDHKTKGNKVNR